MTPKQFAALLAACRGLYVLRDRAWMTVGHYAGFRISEIMSLTIADVVRGGKWVERLVVARRHMKGGRRAGTKVETREVPMHPQIVEALGAWLAQLRRMGYMARGDYVFQSRAAGNRAISIQQAERIIRAAAARAGIVDGVGTHMLRKTFAEAMRVAFGGDIFKVQKALGHLDPKSTQHYLRYSREEIDRAILGMK